MYRWQTLTLARIEHLNHDVTRAQIDAARDALFAIGSKHFPEPAVSYDADPVGKQLRLKWTVDDREWSLAIEPNGTRHDSGRSPGDNWAGLIGGSDTEYIQSSAQWLLFGRSEGSNVGTKFYTDAKARIKIESKTTPFADLIPPIGTVQSTVTPTKGGIHFNAASPSVSFCDDKLKPPPGSVFLSQ